MAQVTEACSCPVKGIIDVVSKKWTLLIVNTLGIHDTLRFKDLTNILGINPSLNKGLSKEFPTTPFHRRSSIR
jgi:DNA-binding HxlR family transcriptional regulator